MLRLRLLAILFVFCAAAASPRAATCQAVFVTGVGPVDRSFGSATVAAPIDPAGAINANPATLSRLPFSGSEFGVEFSWSDTSVSSEVRPLGVSGRTNDESTVSPIPTFALVQKDDQSALAYGLGFFTIAGFRVDYPVSEDNPVLAPPDRGGLGRVAGSAEFYQLVPALSYSILPGTSIGFSPVMTIAKVEATPFVFAEPNPDGSYPSVANPNYRYGGGFQLGIFHWDESGLGLGAAFRSKRWMESFSANVTDESGQQRKESVHFDLPMLLSAGASYSGLQDWLFAAEIRHYDYENAEGFRQEGFDSEGALKGLGWKNILSVSTGVQYSLSEKASFRLGYTYHENPIQDAAASFNIASPLIIQHVLAAGFSYQLFQKTSLALTYVHGFENSVSGPIIKPQGEVPGSSVASRSSADSIGIALTVRH